MRSHEKVGPTRTRGGRKYAGEAESERGRSGNANPIARSNNKRRLPKGSLFFVIRRGGKRSHKKVGPTTPTR